MRLAVFGAAGGTGRLVVARALDAGHEVIASVRRPDALGTPNDRLRVVVSDVRDPDSLPAAVDGADAVVFAAGPPNRSSTVVCSEGVANVLDAMRGAGVKRLLCLTASSIDLPREAPLARRLTVRFLVEKVFRNPYLDMLRMEDELRHSDMEWTVVRVRKLFDGAGTGRYRTAINGFLRGEKAVRRADVADYLLAHLDDTASYRAVVSVSA